MTGTNAPVSVINRCFGGLAGMLTRPNYSVSRGTPFKADGSIRGMQETRKDAVTRVTIGDEAAGQIMPEVQAVLGQRRSVVYERTLAAPDASLRWIEVNLLPQLGEAGEVHSANSSKFPPILFPLHQP